MSTQLTVKTSGLAALGQGPSILGERQASIPVAGRIRPGVQVLTKAAAQNAQARQLYERGVRAGAPFDLIGRTLQERCTADGTRTGKRLFPKSPLHPVNTPFFYLRRGDFSMPEIADAIMARYAEPTRENDTVDIPGLDRRLYRFPIVFPMDEWLAVLPHELACWSASQKRYWSEYRDGRRYCFTRQDLAPGKRPWGGRPVTLRPDNDGLCDPSICPEYNSGACQLSGRLLFYVFGVPGASMVDLPTNSFYALDDMRSKLELVHHIRGRLSGLVDNRPIFWVSKQEREISRIDRNTGKAMRQNQMLITLEADLDTTALFQAHEQSRVLEAGERAAAALSGPASDKDPAIDHDRALDDALASAHQALYEGLQILGLSLGEFAEHAERQHGEDWANDPERVRELAREVSAAVDGDQDAYVARVRGEAKDDLDEDIPF